MLMHRANCLLVGAWTEVRQLWLFTVQQSTLCLLVLHVLFSCTSAAIYSGPQSEGRG